MFVVVTPAEDCSTEVRKIAFLGAFDAVGGVVVLDSEELDVYVAIEVGRKTDGVEVVVCIAVALV
jgi:hypothetical protein